MRTLLILAFFAPIFVAHANQSAKEAACSKYEASALKNAAAGEQLPLIIDTLDTAYDMNLTAEQKGRLLAVFNQILAQNASKLDDLGKNAAFACQLADDSDKQTARDFFMKLIETGL